MQLLLVDDSPGNRDIVRAYLKQFPFELDIAENGQEGLEKFREGVYDLVLMDMLMPVMDGLEATREIRSWELAQGRTRTPIVALTANVMSGDVEQCQAAGCDGHLAKPLKKAALLEAIGTYARSSVA
jgi:CheY-like chemotaxis protein